MDNLVGPCPQLCCAEFDNLVGPTPMLKRYRGD